MANSRNCSGGRIGYIAAVFAAAVAGLGILSDTAPLRAQADTTPPTVLSRSPNPSTTGISTQIVVRAIFSEPIQPATLSFVLRNSGGTVIASTTTYDDGTRTASLDPTSDLAGAATFTATISGVKDLAGNTIAAPVVWSFTTATPSFQQSTVFSGLTEPTAVEFAADGRVFVAEKNGRIKVFSSLTATTPTIFADLRTKVYNYWDRGLLGMALHPQFPSVPYVYVLYAHDAVIGGTAPRWGTPNATSDSCPDPPGATDDGCVISARLSRLQASGNVMVGSEQVMIEDWFQQYPSHSIGTLMFGPDGALYASGGDGASFNFVDYGQVNNPAGDPPGPVGSDLTPPTAQGGALRSQDLRSAGDPVTLDGTVIRIDPDTAAAPPDNPLFLNPDPNAKRIIAHGLRNPFRFTVKPNTREIWIGDVGWSTWEEINRIVDATDSVVDNFGWPCYEGNARQPGYEGANLTLCQQLYNEGAGAVVAPFYAYRHGQQVVSESCGTGSSSTSGLAFYEGTSNYPSNYAGALFFGDYSRNCIWVMFANAQGVPNPATRAPFLTPASTPAQLKIGPGGDLYYVDLGGGTIRRIRYFPGNQPPIARIQAAPTTGGAPLTVAFNATGSTDPENGPLTYAWDLDVDGQFDDSTAAQPNWTYAAGAHVPRVRVTDNQGMFDIASVTILAGEGFPVATINSPASTFTWKVGDVISFSGSATDQQDGPLPAAKLAWSVTMQHCPDSCHSHPLQSFQGVSSGSFSAPDHEYPSYLELTLTATDSAGLQDIETLQIYPKTVTLNFASNPSGLQLLVGPTSSPTPFTRTVIVGSNNSVSAPSPQGSFQFQSWSDGGAQAHNVVAGATPATYTATFVGPPVPPSLVAAYPLDEGSGTTAADASGNANTGTVSGAAWTSPGKFGGALSFDGLDDLITVADKASLDLGAAGTVEGWIKLDDVNRWNGVVAKGNANADELHNYAIEVRPDGRVQCVLGNGANFVVVSSATPLTGGQFYHLACVWTGSQIRLYLNGVIDATAAQTITPAGNTSPLYIGQYGGNVDRFDGVIDDIRIFNVARTDAEVQADMKAPLGVDLVPPGLSNGQPSGTLPPGTTQTTLSLASSENATCRYATSPGVSYAAMPNTFTTTGGTSHSRTVSGLANGTSYNYYVRCQDSAGNANPSDFTIAFAVGTADITAPVRSNGQPTGTLPAGTTQTTLSLTTNENATCRYATTAGLPYSSHPNLFTTTGGTNHSRTLTGLVNGTSYTYYVRCQDPSNNENSSDFPITFAVANPTPGDATPPTVGMTAPVHLATVSGNVTVSANASDNVGVIGVQFLLNGAPVGAEDTTNPYSISWNSATVANGTYQLSARARDAANNQTTATAVSVTVSNSTVVGLVAAYSFNAGAGPTAADASGNGHTGTISGATWSAAGRFGGALSFDGVNDWVTVTDSNLLDLTTGITLEAWVFPTTLGNRVWRTVAIKEEPQNGEVYTLHANGDPNGPSGIVIAQTGTAYIARATPQLATNAWTHLALTYDGTTLRLFVNGIQAATRAASGSLATSTGALRIGGNSTWGEYFAGRIDEIRIYNRALTAAEIQTDMNGGITP